MDYSKIPDWLNTILVVIAALGGKELLSWYLKERNSEKKQRETRNNEIEDGNREISNQVLLQMIEDLKSDINEQRDIEHVLRSQLMKEMSEKVEYRTRLEVLLSQLENEQGNSQNTDN